MGPEAQRLGVPVGELLRSQPTGLVEFDRLGALVLERASQVPSDVLRLAAFLDDGFMSSLPEFVPVLYARLMVAATPGDAAAELDLGEIITRKEDLLSFRPPSDDELVRKREVYDRLLRLTTGIEG